MYKPRKATLLSLFISLITTVISTTQAEMRDPTRPLSFFETDKIEQPNQQLTLSAIWNIGTSKRATINGITAKLGDIILNNIKILAIDTRTVTITQQGEIHKLSLLSKPIKIHPSIY